MSVLRDLVIKLGFKVDGSGLDRVDRGLSSTKGKADATATALRGLGGAMAALGAGATAMAALDKSLEFGKQIGQIQTLLPGATNRVNELKSGIQDLAVKSGKSTEDLSAGVYEVISSFGDTSETLRQTEIAATAATAGATTTLDALNLLSAVTLAYGDTSAKANEKVSDLAFTAVKLGKVTFPELSASIGHVTPLSRQLGVTQEELFATFGTLSGVVGSAAEVSTQYRAIMMAMLKPTAEMQSALNKLGIKHVEAAINASTLQDVLKRLVGTTDGSTEAVAALFGRTESLGATLALTGSLSDRFKTNLDASRQAAGATAEAYAAGTGNANAYGTAIARADAKIAKAVVTFGEHLQEPFLSAKTIIAEAADLAATDLIPAFDALARGIDGVGTSGDEALSVIQPLYTAIKGIVAVGALIKGTGSAIAETAAFDVAALTQIARTGSGSAEVETLRNRYRSRMGALAAQTGVSLEQLGESIDDPRAGAATAAGRRKFRKQEALGVAAAAGERKALAQISQAVNINGDIVVNVPLGARGELDAQDVADAVGKRLSGNMRQFALDVPNAAGAAR